MRLDSHLPGHTSPGVDIRILDGSRLASETLALRARGASDEDVNKLVNRELSNGTFPRLTAEQVAADIHASAALHSARTAVATLARLGRASWDGKGSALEVLIHMPGFEGQQAGGAMWWTGRNFAVVGDGDGKHSRIPYAAAADVVTHEVAHGVWLNTLYPATNGDPEHFTKEAMALSESFGDVIGHAADPEDWLIGEDVDLDGAGGPSFTRDALKPTFTHRSQVKDPEAVDQWTLSGLPTLAAARAAEALGRDGVANVWLQAIEDGDYQPGGTIEDFARATVTAAGRLQIGGAGVEALASAWESVGYLVNASPKFAGLKRS